MLAHLIIKNIVLIDTLEINFQKGLSALTGETGAGKSILLDSLGLSLGMRADSGLVRAGQTAGSVSATYDISSSHPVFSFLQEQSLEVDTPLIFRRHLGADGKSKAYINDQPVSVALMKQAGEYLVEIHGQFDTQTLLNPKTHLGIFDGYALPDDALKPLSRCWKEWKDSKKQLDSIRNKIAQAKEDEAYFQTSLQDLEALDVGKETYEELTVLRERLMRQDKVVENIHLAREKMQEMEDSSAQVWRALENIGAEGQAMIEALDKSNIEIQEVSIMLQDLFDDIENNDYSLEEVDNRLFALKAQARKHDCEVDDLPQKMEEIAALLSAIQADDQSIVKLEKEVEENKQAYITQAKHVSSLRQKAANKLSKQVCTELIPLKLEKARFEVVVETLSEDMWKESGIDAVQFLVATNPGAQPGPLNKIASGGEMARFMLALKVVMAEKEKAMSLVFDEVDSGVGGATAAAVGERLATLSRRHQILVVTHSPQVAAMASHHLLIAKSGDDVVTTSVTPLLEEEKRREEIARMLAGAQVTGEARAAADKLLEASAA